MAESSSHPPAPKKQKRSCYFDKKWIHEFKGITFSSKGKLFQQLEVYYSLPVPDSNININVVANLNRHRLRVLYLAS